MIIIGIALCIVGLFVLLFSWRGRIVARGQFCRKCKFDLAGLDLESDQAKCPECGNEVHQESARRTLLRRRSRLGLVTATLMLIASITTLGVWSSGNASVILGAMPDSIVLALTDMGMDAALDELVIRVSRVPNPMTPSQINRATKMGLAHQADLLVGFDPRWGEVLAIQCMNDQMADDQLKQYMLAGLSFEVLIRDRVHQGGDQIDGLIKASPARMNALTGHDTGYVIMTKWAADGIVGQPSREQTDANKFAAIIRATNNIWTTSAPYPIVPAGEGLNGEIGSKILVYTEYDLILSSVTEEMAAAMGGPYHPHAEELVLGRVRNEHEVEIIDPSEPIVREVQDPKLAQLTSQAIGVLPIKVLKGVFEGTLYSDSDSEIKERTTVFSMSTQSLNLPANIALRAYLRLDDGQEIEFGRWTTRASGGTSLSGIQWSVGAQQYASAQETIRSMVEQGNVDVVFRTDANLVLYTPEIRQVIDMAMVIEDVPIELVKSVSVISSSSADNWINGKQLIEEPNVSNSMQSP